MSVDSAVAPALVAPPVEVVALGREDSAAVLDLDRWAFALDRDQLLPADEQAIADALEWDRTYGARLAQADGSARVAGIYSVRSGEAVVPGGASVPCSGLTWVGVHPRDRRRGVLTALMRHHLADVAARGEPFSLLYAAEATIYGRFGYGTAASSAVLTLPRGPAWRDVPGSDDLVVDVDRADARPWAATLAGCYERGRRLRPGWLSRERAEIWGEILLDPRRTRRGAESRLVMTVSTPDGELRGYALFRRLPKWEHNAPAGTVEVEEAVTLDARAARALWGRLADLDLTSSVETPYLPVDDPLLHLLADPRAARPQLTDGLWARLVDVPSALARRTYARDVDVVLAVTDARLPANAGRWHLVGDGDGARCEPTSAPAQLGLDVRELGAAYFGGPSLAGLAGAGLVDVHDDAALARTSTAFTSPVAPHCGWIF